MAKTKTSTKAASRAGKKSTKTGSTRKAPVKSKGSKVAAKQTVNHDQISQRAYEIWLQRGQPAGQDSAHWFQAERELKEK